MATTRPIFYGCAEFVDAEIDRAVDAVDLVEPTIAVTSDHGHYLGAHGLDRTGFALYDEVTRVPMLSVGSRCSLEPSPTPSSC